MRSQSLKATDLTYSVVISASSHGLQWELALRLGEERSQLGLLPSLGTSTALMTACERGQKWDLALHHFVELRKANAELDAAAYVTATLALLAGGHEALALKLCSDAMACGAFWTRCSAGLLDL